MKLIIIGNGVAGTMAARYVSERDPSVDVTIYSDERYLYYPRPRLIDLVAGQASADAIVQYPIEWYQKRGIQVLLEQPVRALHPKVHEIVVEGGQIVPYDKLILANGAKSWMPPIAGSELANVYTLRNMDDALRLRQVAQRAERAVMLGGGLLGLDLAAAISNHKTEVVVVELLPWLLPRQLDQAGAHILETLMRARGISTITGDSCTLISQEGQRLSVGLKSGRTIATDMVVVSAGVRPSIALAREAGLACNRGIVVDEGLNTSVPDIYAIGDVAEFNTRVWGIIPAALAQAKIVAARVTGDATATYTDIVPSTTLKVTGIDLLSIGEVNPQGEGYTEVRSSDEQAGIYKKLVIRNGRVVGAIVLGERSSVRKVNQLISNDIDVSGHEDELLQEAFDIATLSA